MAGGTENKPVSRTGAVLLGSGIALVGVLLIAVAILGSAEKFHAPRWVVGSIGGSFLLFGGWTAALYALGYDPARPQETLPSPVAQLLVLVPGLLLFAAPFHWIAFGAGPRQFSGGFSLPFVSVSRGAPELGGRIMFGFGAFLIDFIVVAAVVRLAGQQKSRAGEKPARHE